MYAHFLFISPIHFHIKSPFSLFNFSSNFSFSLSAVYSLTSYVFYKSLSNPIEKAHREKIQFLLSISGTPINHVATTHT